MGRLYDAYVEVGPRFSGFGDIKKQGDQAGKQYGKALIAAAEKAAKADVRRLGDALAKARSAEADATGKVRGAEAALTATRSAASTAAGKVSAAEAKLAELRNKGATAKQTATAEAALQKARDNEASATARVVSSEESLAAAQRKAAAASSTAKDAAEALGKAQKRVADAAQGSGGIAGGRFSSAFKGALSKLGGDKEGKQFATRFGVGMNGAIGGIVSRSAGVFAAGFAAVKGAQVFAGFINDARESARVGNLTAQVIKSTGGAAKVSADQVGNLATAISNKTGADDEAIQSGQNLLLTFTNIQNGVGKGNDIFNQASQAVTDMTAAMNGGIVSQEGIKASSIQVGKALNDPIKGVTALSKVGVSFTQSQKDQIKTLVDSGKTMEAQKIILGELGKEFGGAAAAASDPLTKLKTVVGNLSEQVGGYLLPVVDKFANFLLNTGIPGVEGLISAFQGEGVTSDGFVGFMERVGIAARTVFDYFKTDVLPRLKEFGGFVINTVVPAVAGFVSTLVTNLAPAVKDVFGFFKTEVLPRLQEFAGFLIQKVLPPIGEFASKVLASKDFLVPFAAVIVTVITAMKAWAIAQGILNVVMSANPIGLVVLAIAGLVAGLIYAYKHSETFRNILQGAFQGIQKAAQTFAPLVKAAIDIVIGVFSLWWNYFAKPILKQFGAALVVAWGLAQKFGGFVVAAFNGIKEPAFAALKWVIGKFLDFVGSMLNGAAKAFGWVPGLGPKLKTAAKEFGQFRDNVNAALNGVKDQTITVTAKLNSANVNKKNANDRRLAAANAGYAFGGAVRGSGSGTSDSIPAMLSNGEHVWTAKEVRNAGGHGAVEQMRSRFRGYASGGPVQFNVEPKTSNAKRFAKEVAAHAVAAVRPAAQALADQTFALTGTPGKVRSFRGVKLNDLTISRLLHAEQILGRIFHITQGSYSTRVAASGSTHAGGGAMDTNGPGGWNAAVAALRKSGFAAWHRTPSQGPWRDHIHSIAIGDPSASSAAKNQVKSFLRGGDGLGHGMKDGGKVPGYAEGSLRIPRNQLAYLHKGEMVVPAQLAGSLRGILGGKLHQLHVLHTKHTQHLAHLAHVGRPLTVSADTSGNGVTGTIRLHPDDMRHLGGIVADNLRANPLQVSLDGRKVDDAFTHSAVSRGI